MLISFIIFALQLVAIDLNCHVHVGMTYLMWNKKTLDIAELEWLLHRGKYAS